MIHQKIKNLFMSSVEHVCSNISNYSIHPDIDLSPRQSSFLAASRVFVAAFSPFNWI